MAKVVLPDGVMLEEVVRLLDEGRDVVFAPKGRSMLPFIRGEEDRVLLRKPDGIAVGDIVLAKIGGRYILHRVYVTDGEKITLMGDGNLQGTEQGTIDDVMGKVVEIMTPDGRRHRPSKGWLWRRLLPFRKYLLKVYRKWNNWFK